MKTRRSSEVMTSMRDFCRRNQIPVSHEDLNAFLIEKYNGPTQDVSVFIFYDPSNFRLVVNPKSGETIDSSVLGDVLTYHNAANSASVNTTLFVCPHCERIEMFATIHRHDDGLSDIEIEEMLDQIMGQFEYHASVVQDIISGKVKIADAVQKAMERKRLI